VQWTVLTASEPETSDAGERLAADLHPGDVVLLYGDLGAGKTAFVRGRGGRATLHHVDLYRLEPREIGDLGLDELISGDSIVAIEWAERWPDAPAPAWEVRLAHAGDERRRIEVRLKAEG
jgi:tRNA threonylcarbamoyladenosine biosynthesis protein TsaE